MPIHYSVNDGEYVISYSELKEKYLWFVSLSDKEFEENIKEALHFACIVCWFKEIPTQNCLSDEGVIHQMTHFLHIPETTPLSAVRAIFNSTLKLS